MSNENNEKVVREIIEYANQEIAKSKKKTRIILLSILSSLVLLAAAFLFVFVFETPVPYSDGLICVSVPEDKGIDIKVNLSNYKNAKAVLVNVDETAYDLYINVTQTLSTKIFEDNDNTNNMLRVGNSIIVDFQSGLLRGNLPNGCNAEKILNIYYVDNLSNKTMAKDDSELAKDPSKVLIWTRDSQ